MAVRRTRASPSAGSPTATYCRRSTSGPCVRSEWRVAYSDSWLCVRTRQVTITPGTRGARSLLPLRWRPKLACPGGNLPSTAVELRTKIVPHLASAGRAPCGTAPPVRGPEPVGRLPRPDGRATAGSTESAPHPGPRQMARLARSPPSILVPTRPAPVTSSRANSPGTPVGSRSAPRRRPPRGPSPSCPVRCPLPGCPPRAPASPRRGPSSPRPRWE